MKTFRIFTTGGDILAVGDGIRLDDFWGRVIVYALPELTDADGMGKSLARINAETRVVAELLKDRVLGFRDESAPGSAVMVTIAPVTDLR